MTYLALKLVLISSARKKQEACKRAIESYAKESTLKREFLQQDVLRKWTQPAINAFFRYCFSRHVILEMNTTINYVALSGSKESVNEAEIEYNREQVRQSEQARLAVIAQDIVWAYQVDEKNWEKYPRELNVRIEDAHASKMTSVSASVSRIILMSN